MEARRKGRALVACLLACLGAAEARAGDAPPVRLKAAFDPALPPTAEPAGRYQIIQFDSSVTATVQEELLRRGVEIIEFIPSRALLVRVPAPGDEGVLRTMPGVRIVRPFLPAYKLSPELSELLREPGDEKLTLDVLLFDKEDTPPVPEGARVTFFRPRAPRRLTLELSPDLLDEVVDALIRDPAVHFVERRLPIELHNDFSVWIGQSYDRVNGPVEAEAADPKPYTLSATVWNRGLSGAGQVVAVADTGLEHTMCFFDDPSNPVVPQNVTPPAALTVDPSHRKILALNGTSASSFLADDSYRHGTHVAATIAGDDAAHPAQGGSAGHDHGDGMAPEAKIVFEDVGPSVDGACSTTIVVPSALDLFDQEYAAGATITSNSWGSGTGAYTTGAREVDVAVWQNEELLVVFSAGNDGAGGFDDYAACKNCLAVGAAENYDPTFVDIFGILDPENMTAFSSRGPAADGRIKPDLTAPGYFVRSARLPVQYVADELDPLCDPTDPDVCFPSFGGCYITDTSLSCHADRLLGTSMSTPTVAGLAALARQYFVDGFHPGGQASPADSMVPSAALLRAVLLNGARNMTGHLYERRGGAPADFGPLADAPSDVQGWGRVMLDDALYFAGDARRVVLRDVANASGLRTGQSSATEIGVTSPAQPLKITLAWTDPPGSVVAGAALVNDLDLEVTAPDGTLHRGNQWTADDPGVPGDKQSLADPAGKDGLNNVEGILIPAPQIGVHTVTVLGADVPGFQGMKDQGFALVATGAVTEVGVSPPPVPDGSFGSPLAASRADLAGSAIDLSWDVTGCVAPDYHLLFGDLGDVQTLTLAGSVCDLGISGSHTWTGVPGGDLWFLLVGDDDATNEGSWGTDGGGAPRNGATASGECLLSSRVNGGSC